MTITPVKDMVAAATAKIESVPVADAQARMHDDDFQLVDIRDPRELDREGRIPGAFHAPRGMLEFWVDPASPYHKPIFASGKKLVFFCASAWRSALSVETLNAMGLENAAQLEGGFSAWRKAGAPIDKAE
ncbi:MAG: rhodanese-like domain-containing protein [Pikeienuella sp.]